MPEKRESPSVRLKKAGYRQVGPLWLTGQQYADAVQAAEGQPLTQLFIRGGLLLAEKKLSQKRKKSDKKP